VKTINCTTHFECDCIAAHRITMGALITELEAKCAWQAEMLERARNYVHTGLDCPNCCTKDMQRFNPDFERGYEEGK